MTSERWRRIEQIYEDALQRIPSERGAFLESACGGDEMLRRDVERLIMANGEAGGFLASPAWELASGGLVAATMTHDRDSSLVGREVGHYRILAPLGSGGMGEVYRAHDSKLNRQVALKVLPDLFSRDPDRLARFKREAHVLATLNHPNIAAIHGFEDSGEVRALVLELVEGPTLADRIARGRIPLEEALPIARQTAEALEAAHERGIVHRDLKPANVKVRSDGVVKVLDFGLAKALDVESSGNLSQPPTVPGPVVTDDGIIIGTPAYMAPEQARGKPADKGTDLWAFGCVLYEMLTGRRPFGGEHTSETLAAVIKDDPDWRALTEETPASIRRLLRRCLAKDPKRRLPDAAVARIEIDEAFAEPPSDTSSAQTTSRRKERFAWAVALLLVTASAIAAVMYGRRAEDPANEVRFDIPTPPTTDSMSLAISPNGQKIVFVATSEGQNKLWLRPLGSATAKPLAGTDGAVAPFWSPDSRSIAFFTSTDNRIKHLDIDGGSMRVLGTFPLATGGTWNRDGTILFSTLAGPTPIFRISDKGGQATRATQLRAPEDTHQLPRFLPDGRHFLYHSPSLTPPAVFLGDLDGSESRRLLEADTAAVWIPSGYLLFGRDGALYAQAFDPDTLVLSGNQFRVVEQVETASWLAALSVSATGTLVYRAGSPGQRPAPSVFFQRPLVWFDRSGNEIAKVGDPAPGFRPSLSVDGRRVAVSRSANQLGPPDIWLIGVDRGDLNKVTDNGAINLDPIWSPDGKEIVFSSSMKDVFNLYRKRLDGRKEDLLLATPEPKMPSDWSRDGFLLYQTGDPKTGTDVWALPLNRDLKHFPVVQTPYEERDAQFSPDGRWIAYQSNKTGQFEIYLQPFRRPGEPGPGEPQAVSTTGGAQVRWRPDGRELFYIALDGRLMAVPIRFAPDAQGVHIDPAVPLFATHVGGAVSGLERQQYMVSPDGQRFLMSVVPENANPSPIRVIQNWQLRPPR
jgi:serine/threonine protein kinase